MSSIKKLAGQTLWYGVPTITSRFLGYLLNIILFRLFKPVETADITQIYAVIPFLNILFTYGVETSFFRFAQVKDKAALYRTLNVSIIFSTLLFSAALWLLKDQLTVWLHIQEHPQYISWMIGILFFDTLATLPFARLRLEGRPRKFALVKSINILSFVFFAWLFLVWMPKMYHQQPDGPIFLVYNPDFGISYYLLANLLASILTLLLLWKEWKSFRWIFDRQLWKEVMIYSYPLVIVGLGGMINEMLSRLVYQSVLKLPVEQEKYQLGVFGANYKLAVLITIFIQVFRMGAEPFFFNQSKHEDAPKTYARVMKFFVLACCLMYLVIVLFLEDWGNLAFGKNREYMEGLSIVPVLAMGSVMLGIYYNLSVWYKLTNRTLTGAWITLGGAVITIALNIWWIPLFHYKGSAWATFSCYAFMMLISYVLGQKYYRIPYAWKKLVAYLVICVLLFMAHQFFGFLVKNPWGNRGFAVILLLLFSWFILRVEKKEFQRIPVLKKFV